MVKNAAAVAVVAVVAAVLTANVRGNQGRSARNAKASNNGLIASGIHVLRLYRTRNR